jgi:tetratricopeptide (TPR) repeat protein
MTLGSARASPRAQSAQSPIVEHFLAGQRAMREGKPQEAVAEFRQVLRLAPGLDQARINLGLAYHLLGEYQLAAAQLEEGLRRHPGLPGPDTVLGIDELKLGDPSKAIAPLKKAFDLDPSNQQAASSLANAYFMTGDYASATRTYRAMDKKGANDAEDQLRLGYAYLHMSSQLTVRLAQHENSAWTARMAGDLWAEQGRLADAEGRYRSALSRDPSQPDLHDSLGTVLLEQGDAAGAAREFRSALSRDPQDPAAFLGLAQIALIAGHIQPALQYASKAAQISPEFLQNYFLTVNLAPATAAQLVKEMSRLHGTPEAHFLLAALYRSESDVTDAARERTASAAALRPLGKERRPGQSACEAHDYARCITSLRQRSHLDPSQALVLGRAFYALDEYANASEAFGAALGAEHDGDQALYWLIRADSAVAGRYFSGLEAAFPSSAQADEVRAEMDRIRGEDGRATQEYRLAATIAPEDAEIHRALGDLYLQRKELTAAAGELKQSLELNPTNPETLYLLGRVSIGLQKPEVAIGYLQRALAYSPSLLKARASLGMAYLEAGKPALAVPQFVQAEPLDSYGDLHYMLFQAYQRLGELGKAKAALAVSQALRKRTQSRDQALIQAAGKQAGKDLQVP